jgi:hypothetical protein
MNHSKWEEHQVLSSLSPHVAAVGAGGPWPAGRPPRGTGRQVTWVLGQVGSAKTGSRRGLRAQPRHVGRVQPYCVFTKGGRETPEGRLAGLVELDRRTVFD